MPFQFDPSEYKNKFTATVISSELRPNDTDPTREVWYATLLRVRPNATHSEWEPIDTGLACQLPGCVNIKPWHTHARWYESDRQFSPAHKFVESIKVNGKTDPSGGPASILNRTYIWEEEIQPERRNPNTGGMYKEQRNYYISGVAELTVQTHEVTQPATTNGGSGELPWDATIPQTQTVGAPVVVTQPAVATATVALPYEEAAMQIAETLMDGKTHEEVRQLIVSNATFRSVPGLLFKFVNGTMVQELKDSALITQDEQGVFHVPAA